MQRYFATYKKDNYIFISDNDIHHIKNVMRMKPNDTIECIYDNKVYICNIISPNSNKVEIKNILDDNNELPKDVTIAIALVKEQKMDLILQKLTELGINKIIPLKMERSIIKLDEKRSLKKIERWQSICKEAAEQSKRNKIPEVTTIKSLKDLTEYQYDFKFVCSVNNKENLVNKYLQNTNDYVRMLFVIGPEGGITPKEERFLNNNGFTSISLGKQVLRVETAAIYVASIINFSSMR